MSPKKSKIAQAQMEASYASLQAAKQFYDAGPIGQMPSSAKAIELANSNVGNYLPDLQKSRDYTDLSATGITQDQIDGYMNPYLQDVLNYSIKDMEDAAAQQREAQRAIASKSGNDFASSGGTANRYQVEDDLNNRSLYRDIGALSAQTRSDAYDKATGLATDERNRQLYAGNTYGNIANTTSALGAKDVGMLSAAGQEEALPEQNKRDWLTNTINNYKTSTTGAQPSVETYQKTSPLSQILGLGVAAATTFGMPALGGLGSAGGALSGLGGSSMGTGALANAASGQFRPSDRRLKRGIRRVGTHRLGIGLYEWTYLWGKKGYGVMADEVRKVMPAAISTVAGFDAVNYSMIGD
jgi:hypothetical protein